MRREEEKAYHWNPNPTVPLILFILFNLLLCIPYRLHFSDRLNLLFYYLPFSRMWRLQECDHRLPGLDREAADVWVAPPRMSSTSYTHSPLHKTALALPFSLYTSYLLLFPGSACCLLMIDGLHSETEQPPLFVCLCFA